MILADREGFGEINLPCAELPEQISALSKQFPPTDEEKWKRNVRKCIKDKRDPAASAGELYFSRVCVSTAVVIEINLIIYIKNCITDYTRVQKDSCSLLDCNCNSQFHVFLNAH